MVTTSGNKEYVNSVLAFDLDGQASTKMINKTNESNYTKNKKESIELLKSVASTAANKVTDK